MTKTEHYQLNQWDAGDRVLREDFNEDNRKIEEALAQKHGAVFGTYTGDGAASMTVSLGFTPLFLYTCTRDGKAGSATGSGYCYGGLASRDTPVCWNSDIAVEIVEDGFRVTNPHDYIRTNLSGQVYHFLAIR